MAELTPIDRLKELDKEKKELLDKIKQDKLDAKEKLKADNFNNKKRLIETAEIIAKIKSDIYTYNKMKMKDKITYNILDKIADIIKPDTFEPITETTTGGI